MDAQALTATIAHIVRASAQGASSVYALVDDDDAARAALVHHAGVEARAGGLVTSILRLDDDVLDDNVMLHRRAHARLATTSRPHDALAYVLDRAARRLAARRTSHDRALSLHDDGDLRAPLTAPALPEDVRRVLHDFFAVPSSDASEVLARYLSGAQLDDHMRDLLGVERALSTCDLVRGAEVLTAIARAAGYLGALVIVDGVERALAGPRRRAALTTLQRICIEGGGPRGLSWMLAGTPASFEDARFPEARLVQERARALHRLSRDDGNHRTPTLPRSALLATRGTTSEIEVSIPKLGGFRILKHLGGSRKTFLAIHDDGGAPLTIKVLPPELSEQPEHVARLAREVVRAKRVSHPGVCRLYGLHEEGRTRYLTMEHVDGTSLTSSIEDDRSMPWRRVVSLGVSICDALAAAHDVEVLHGGLQARHVLLRPSGDACLLDVGTAFAHAPLARRPRAVLDASHDSMALEVLRGESAPTVLSDLFSLGVVLYRCATGRMPFTCDTEVRRVREMLRNSPPPPSLLTPGLPTSLDRALLRAIEAEPEQRFGSVRAFRDALLRVEAERSTSGPRSTVPLSTSSRARAL